jgi:hypothetical protein
MYQLWKPVVENEMYEFRDHLEKFKLIFQTDIAALLFANRNYLSLIIGEK